MAGGGITVTPLEVARLRRLLNDPDRVGRWLTALDEDGWSAAQEMLADFARRDAEIERVYQIEQQSETSGDNP
jgi:hypothetical protein